MSLSHPNRLEIAIAAKASEAARERRRALYWQGISTGMGIAVTAFLAVLVVVAIQITRAPAPPAEPTGGQILCDSWHPTGRQCGNGGCEWQKVCYECGPSGCEVHHIETTCIGSGQSNCPSGLPGALPEPERWSNTETDWLRDDGVSIPMWIEQAGVP